MSCSPGSSGSARLLAAEGLFDAVRKRPLPFAPAVVGVITGRESAAERDVLVTARRRWPAVRFAVHNCAVQGPTAAESVMAGLRKLDADPAVEVIVIARGGGSVEDLLPFSDEGLVRAIAATRTPVVTAVGHETDTTLVDHVADVRAATPTDAAHRVVPEIGEQRRLVDGLRARARHLLGSPPRAAGALAGVGAQPAGAGRPAAAAGRPGRRRRSALRSRATRTLTHRVEGAERDLEHARARVAALSPQATLERGYAVVQRADGALVRDPAEVADDERLQVRVAGGRLPVRVDRAASDGGARSETGHERHRDAEPTQTYEQAREELADVVRKLEAGGLTLEESLTLWERGEQLAEVCQHWLDRARERLAAAAPTAPTAGATCRDGLRAA